MDRRSAIKLLVAAPIATPSVIQAAATSYASGGYIYGASALPFVGMPQSCEALSIQIDTKPMIAEIERLRQIAQAAQFGNEPHGDAFVIAQMREHDLCEC